MLLGPSTARVEVGGKTYRVARNSAGMFWVELFIPTKPHGKWRHWRSLRSTGPAAQSAIRAARKEFEAADAAKES